MTDRTFTMTQAERHVSCSNASRTWASMPSFTAIRHAREALEDDHYDSSCFTCILLDHGEEGVTYRRWSPALEEMCKSLVGKPKHFTQACLGSEFDNDIHTGLGLLSNTLVTDANLRCKTLCLLR